MLEVSAAGDMGSLWLDPAGEVEAAELRDRALRLLAVGIGDHTPVEVQEQVAEIARRLAQVEPPVHEWA
jgi:hypothetical protein